jgi:hypothetical protein
MRTVTVVRLRSYSRIRFGSRVLLGPRSVSISIICEYIWAAPNHPHWQGEQGGDRGYKIGSHRVMHTAELARTRIFSNRNEYATLQEALTGGAKTASVCRIYPHQARVWRGSYPLAWPSRVHATDEYYKYSN